MTNSARLREVAVALRRRQLFSSVLTHIHSPFLTLISMFWIKASVTWASVSMFVTLETTDGSLLLRTRKIHVRKNTDGSPYRAGLDGCVNHKCAWQDACAAQRSGGQGQGSAFESKLSQAHLHSQQQHVVLCSRPCVPAHCRWVTPFALLSCNLAKTNHKSRQDVGHGVGNKGLVGNIDDLGITCQIRIANPSFQMSLYCVVSSNNLWPQFFRVFFRRSY